jgi:hypothetical protein
VMDPDWLPRFTRNMMRRLATSLGAVAAPVIVGLLLAFLFPAPCSSSVCFGPIPDWGIPLVIAAIPLGALAMWAMGKRNDWY